MVVLVVSGLLLRFALVRWSRRGAGYGKNGQNITKLGRPNGLGSARGHLSEVNLSRLFKPGKYSMTMGLRRLDEKNWLTIDEEYLPEHRLRAELLSKSRNKVLQCLPGSEVACVEVLEFVVSFLIKRWPEVFELFGETDGDGVDGGRYFVRNNKTGEEFRIVAPYEVEPLEIAARLAIEDFNLLVKGEESGEYLL
ncbi:MAG: hypothetical protein M1839_004264 [Geoglossum umbratile]|nr:MAG: hypothetical protein M1839_004264 [Geoglossum umbratile]